MSHHKKPVQPLPPLDKLYLTAGNLEDPKHKAALNKAVARQPFLSHLDFALSTNAPVSDLPSEIKDLIQQYTFSHARMNAADLLKTEFMNAYIRGKSLGSLVLLSGNDSAEDVIAIDGKGHLVLSLCKDTHSIFGMPGHPSRFGPKRDRYYVEIDLSPEYMRAGKSGFERIRTGLRKLGEKDFIATYTDSSGEPGRVEFPSSATSKSNLKYRISCTHSRVTSSSDLFELQDKLSTYDFRNAKTLKRKRETLVDPEESGIFVQELLEAVASVDLNSSPTTALGVSQAEARDLLSVSVDGLLHPRLAQDLLAYFSTADDYNLISMSAQTMSHSPLERAIKRKNGEAKPDMRGKEERAVDSGVLDGWSVLFATPTGGKTRFVFVDSASS
ncbi:hypothetical protein P389DRAFT_198527 [Cystobasidium minutum MCA 4210]|uniref:uncharacterized protein n=1 Tax=Cystobasidium minutum MCA 4210 TaxID=1397322 RepID=UPI0034CD13AD|eukprot:jgi/Rhomi1/198527/gm1.6741_g